MTGVLKRNMARLFDVLPHIRRSRLVMVCVFTGLSCLLAFSFIGQAENNADVPAPQAGAGTEFTVITINSQAKKRPLKLWLTGETEALSRVPVKAETYGKIIERPIEKGDYVRKDDVLCRLDEGTRLAEIARAKAALAKAEFDLSASMKLFATGNVAENRIQADRARINAARADLAASELDKMRLIIRAPTDGVIEGPLPEVGERLATGLACAVIVSYNPIVLVGQFSERHANTIHVGAPVEAVIGDQIVKTGGVSYVAPSANPRTHSFRVESELDNGNGSIREGMSVRFSITLDEKPVHIIPRSALALSDSGELGVKALIEGRVQFFPVSLVNEDDQGLWVIAEPDDMILITIGHEYVIQGQMVPSVEHKRLESKL